METRCIGSFSYRLWKKPYLSIVGSIEGSFIKQNCWCNPCLPAEKCCEEASSMRLTENGYRLKRYWECTKPFITASAWRSTVRAIFRLLKKIDTPVDQQLCVITGDDSLTVQLDRVKICIRIDPNKIFNWFMLDILYLFDLCGAQRETCNSSKSECRKSALLNLLIWPSHSSFILSWFSLFETETTFTLLCLISK